jgi:hypothetical protein
MGTPDPKVCKPCSIDSKKGGPDWELGTEKRCVKSAHGLKGMPMPVSRARKGAVLRLYRSGLIGWAYAPGIIGLQSVQVASV